MRAGRFGPNMLTAGQAERRWRAFVRQYADPMQLVLLAAGIAGIALVASMALNLARGETFTAVFNAAVAFAIAAIPVNLPTVVTTVFAW